MRALVSLQITSAPLPHTGFWHFKCPTVCSVCSSFGPALSPSPCLLVVASTATHLVPTAAAAFPSHVFCPQLLCQLLQDFPPGQGWPCTSGGPKQDKIGGPASQCIYVPSNIHKTSYHMQSLRILLYLYQHDGEQIFYY